MAIFDWLGKTAVSRPLKALLVAPRAQQARYLVAWRKAIEAAVPGTRCCIYHGDMSQLFRTDQKSVEAILNRKWISEWKAKHTHWDLIVMANHGVWSPRQARARIFVGHGIDTGISPHKGNYHFGQMPRNTLEQVPYDLVVVKSDAELAVAKSLRPDAEQKAVVAGDPLLDTLLELAPKSAECRMGLSIPPDAKTLCLLSTWGEHSLLSRYGHMLPRAISAAVSSGWQVLICSHPNNFGIDGKTASDLRPLLRDLTRAGAKVCPLEADWQSYLAASTLGVGDHTSLSLYYLFLDRPFGFVNSANWNWSEAPNGCLSPLKDLAEGAVKIDTIDEHFPDRLDHLGNQTQPPIQLEALKQISVTRLRRGQSDIDTIVLEIAKCLREDFDSSGNLPSRVRAAVHNPDTHKAA